MLCVRSANMQSPNIGVRCLLAAETQRIVFGRLIRGEPVAQPADELSQGWKIGSFAPRKGSTEANTPAAMGRLVFALFRVGGDQRSMNTQPTTPMDTAIEAGR